MPPIVARFEATARAQRKAVRQERRVELVLDDASLDAGRAPLRVDRQDAFM